MTKFRKEYQAGFTMIEVLLVVVLFSIAVGAIFPNFKQFYNNLVFDGFVQRIVKSFEYARARAVMEDAFLRLSINTQENTYVLEIKDEAEGSRKEFTQLEGKFGKVFTVPGDLRFGSVTSDEIYFNPDGSVGRYRIEIEDEGSRRANITGDDFFGTPKVVEEDI